MTRPSEGTILLVDDDPAVRDSLKVLLELYGFEVVDFSSAGALLDGYSILPGSCLVADVEMPEVGGIELLARLSSKGEQLPAVLITGRIDHNVRRHAGNAGAFALIEKPFDSAILIDTVRRALASAREQRRDGVCPCVTPTSTSKY